MRNFHAFTINRKKRNAICMLRLEDGVGAKIRIDSKRVQLGSFGNSLLLRIAGALGSILWVDSSSLRESQLRCLIRPVNMEEVRPTLFMMHPLKGSGIDAYQVAFFQKKWSVVGTSLGKAVIDSFENGSLID
ncbi:hypothetical protein F3Y22_tig00110410pilonHSYRG00134 [Hibiscus syriacus]|uniref:Uncharacterized protein n=2 Tax=Hibiscus syriacus TaxID=106335 RepID=A0A6A3AN52_HIBSY|nr:hypothetical protein F3Y22_tig00110410pilonHSYRG00134 [Hibiscus syriacus]